MFGCGCHLLNIMEVFSMGRGALLERPGMVSKECAYCVCIPEFKKKSFCKSEVISPFKCLRAGSHAFALLMLFLCDFTPLCG